ncbi:myb-like DNA-binding domain-containing protein [Pochonia chlamydosporia 170]|uniref:Myb-like DNA-binding domain-containing protein n=1 Tax=Pochonia chlamydosporia 170 TaxID=1380566 RepID=A0A179EYA6_METCM|nr:myb-like DNA-binding domain-containing protein [Pochonia chlamydosporia 170]OAQ58142.1 myb-like DNA-binding domain-containing protein [Pochonia chlamydosporia 170]
MNKPLKFKSYNPSLQRLQKKKKVFMPKTHSRGLVSHENPGQCEAVTETSSENHDLIDTMFINPTLVNWSNDSCVAPQLENSCSPFNEDSRVVHEHPQTSISLAVQSAPTGCWQPAEVQSLPGPEEDAAVDSRWSSWNNNNHFICPLSPPSPDRPTTRARTETPSPDSPCGGHVSVSCWLQADQQPNNIKSNLQLEHDHDVVETTNEQQRKRPKLTLPDESSHSPHGTTEDNNSNLDDNDSGESAAIPYSMRGLDAATAHNESLLSPHASIQLDAPAFVPTCPSGQCSSHRREEAIPRQSNKAEASCSACAAPQETNYLPRMQYMRQASKCKSCSTLRVALLESLSLLQHLLDEDVPSTGCEPVGDISNSSYGLGNGFRVDTSSCGETLDTYTPSDEGDERSAVQVEVTNLSGQQRQLSQLEERRLRAWRRENKSESWIASKLKNSKSARFDVRRANTQMSTTRAKFTSDEDDLIKTLKEEEQLTWTQIQERHDNQFHRRSKESLQVRYCTKLKNREKA